MLQGLRSILFGTLRRQLTVGVAVVVVVVMTGFVAQMTLRQREASTERLSLIATGLGRTLATAAASGLAARDLAGLQELAESARGLPQLEFAMLADLQGRVLAHTDGRYVGQYLQDLPAAGEGAQVIRSAALIDVTSPALLAGHRVGWARVGLSRQVADAEIAEITRRGALLAVGAAALAMLMAALIGYWFTRRLAVIRLAADAVNRGDQSRRALLDGHDEAAHLARDFNRMLDSLAASRADLVSSEQRLLLALQAASMATWRWEVATDRIRWSVGREHLFGPAPPGGQYPELLDMVLEDDRAMMRAAAAAALLPGGDYAVEFRIRRTDGTLRWLSARGRMLRDELDRPVVMLGVSQDVSERRSAEQALADTEQRWLIALEGSDLGVWDWHVPSDTIYYSHLWKAMLGLADDEVGSHLVDWSDRVHPDDLAGCMAAVDRCFSGEQPHYRVEHRMRAADGRWKWILSQGTLFSRSDDGRPLRMVGTHTDMTERKAMEAELIRHRDHLEDLVAERTAELNTARGEAERLARVKSEFLANMSHEIRTPLNAVLGLAQVGAREHPSNSAGPTFARIREAGGHLLAVINDILDFSRLEAGKLSIERRAFWLAGTVDRVGALLAGALQQKGLRYEVLIDPRVPGWVQGDARRLEQILVNLLGNAVKFTERGEVCLRVLPQGGDIVFALSDTGMGLSAEQVARLFRPFEQGDGSTTRRFGGSGLGLAISRDLARLMGGDLAVTSTPGQGSCFSLHLPLPAALPGMVQDLLAPAAVPPPNRLQGLRVLVAEDAELNRMVLEAMMDHEGALLRFAEDGAQAVALVEADSQAFDLVLMDIQMPVMDGYEAARRLRALAPALPVIGLTAHALQEERDKCRAVGMVDHVTKPVDVEELVAAMLGALPAGVDVPGRRSGAGVVGP